VTLRLTVNVDLFVQSQNAEFVELNKLMRLFVSDDFYLRTNSLVIRLPRAWWQSTNPQHTTTSCTTYNNPYKIKQVRQQDAHPPYGDSWTYVQHHDSLFKANIYSDDCNLSSALCDLNLWPTDLKADRFTPLPVDHLCQFASNQFNHFQNIVLTSLLTDGWTDKLSNRLRTHCLCLSVWPGGAIMRA